MPYFNNGSEIRRTWDEYLEGFRKEVYPTFESYGISFELALELYESNGVRNSIRELLSKFEIVHDEDKEDDEEPWKKK